VIVNGIVEYAFGEKQIKSDEYQQIPNISEEKELPHFNRIVPVYPLTEGVSQKWLREIIKGCIDNYASVWPEILPETLRRKHQLIPAGEALRAIHFPGDFVEAEKARQRQAFDEFILLETALALSRRNNSSFRKRYSYQIKKTILTPFREKLQFEFTAAQKKVINEIFSDMQSPVSMNRLLLGDVGSGKTVVAVSAMLLAVENGYQAALLAPTEILAEQHFLSLKKMLQGLPVRICLLTSKIAQKKKEKEKIIAALSAGEIDILIGTHAILENPIKFNKLSLAIIDEQHRFGVLQRAALHKKGVLPDILVMTATPIPRSLALTMYGDMDVSVIDALPPGRQPIQTLHLSESGAYSLVKKEIAKGHQAYIVYPLVEESDKIELKAAVTEAKNLSETIFHGFSVGLLHGQMAAAEKETVMNDFRSGKYTILFSTTIIEVGIDVPNATVMVIEHAERFGLASLHQLRGRIGRGKDLSYCVLVGGGKSEDARRRIAVMLSTNNGFKIAEEDLALRGPGEFLGTAQHGELLLKAGNLATDRSIIETARDSAYAIVEKDPQLTDKEHATLCNAIKTLFQHRLSLLRIG
jgi:ATP-dependent DNA helicase RecG